MDNIIGIVTILENYTASVIHKGVTVSVQASQILVDFGKTYFKNKPYVHITQRNIFYTLDTAIYEETAKIKNLIGSAVSTKGMALTNTSNEKRFFSKPFEIFEELDDTKFRYKKLYKSELQNKKIVKILKF